MMTKRATGNTKHNAEVTKEDLATTRVKKENVGHEGEESKEKDKPTDTEKNQRNEKEAEEKTLITHSKKPIKKGIYHKILGPTSDEILDKLSPKGAAILDLMAKYASIANPNVMLSEENKVLAPHTLLRFLTALDSLLSAEPEQVSMLVAVIKSNVMVDNKLGVFNQVYVKRECFSYASFKPDDKDRLFKLIDVHLT